MPKSTTVRIEHIEVKKRSIDMIKKAFNIKDSTEAVRIAIDSIAGNLEIKKFFENNKGLKLKKIYD
ncbi:MAG: hypothetical protein FJ240_08455 [Nitrospira sp.]|nr:hypothetical protein [Nitrospira sp.]